MGTSQGFAAEVDARNGVIRLVLSGELDMATAPILNDLLGDLEREAAEVIMVDLRDLNFIDSSGLEAFVKAYARSQLDGHRFLIIGESRITRRLFEITGTEFLLDASGTADLFDRFTGDGSGTSNEDDDASIDAHV